MITHESMPSSVVSGELLLFRTMWNNSSDNMFIVRRDENGEFINESCNRSQEETFGLSPHQVDGVNLKTILDENTYELVSERYNKCISLNKPVTYEESVVIDDSGHRYWNTTILPVVDENGVRIFGISREITELKNLNENLELKVAEKTKDTNTLLSLFDKGETILFRWNNDEHWSVNYVSQNVEKLLGYTIEEFMNNKIQYEQCIYKEDLPRVMNEVEKNSALDIDYFKHEPYRIVKKDGTVIYILDYTVMIRDDSGKITHFLGYITDITKDIENEKLKKEQAKLIVEQTKNTQMSEMIKNISHQWRQPLSIISTAASGIKLQKEFGLCTQEQELEMLDKISEAAQYLSTTIDVFRDYIKEKKEYREVILQDRLNLTLDLVKASLENHNITLISNIDKVEPIKIEMILGKLSDIVINIINNAKDALHTNKIKNPYIKIDLEKKEDLAIVTIEDNGGGINESILPKIFDPYFTTKHKSQGTGLGLHVSKEIVEKDFQGRLYVKNSENGAIFTMELPLIF